MPLPIKSRSWGILERPILRVRAGFPHLAVDRESFPRAKGKIAFRKVRAKGKIFPPKVRAKGKTITYRRQVVIKTSSRNDWPCGNKIKESKARIEGGSAAAIRAIPPFS